jgi:5-methylcytosine-specific restriction endonuclease McrA
MSFTKKQRYKIHRKFDGHCGYCGKLITLKEMQVDHMNPKSLRYIKGDFNDHNNDSNLMPSCRRCNHYKRDATVEQFRRIMSSLHERLQKIYIVKVGLDFGIIEIKAHDGTFYFERCNDQ